MLHFEALSLIPQQPPTLTGHLSPVEASVGPRHRGQTDKPDNRPQTVWPRCRCQGQGQGQGQLTNLFSETKLVHSRMLPMDVTVALWYVIEASWSIGCIMAAQFPLYYNCSYHWSVCRRLGYHDNFMRDSLIGEQIFKSETRIGRVTKCESGRVIYRHR